MRDADLKEKIQKVYTSNYRVYGARKVWRELNRQGHAVARCTVERLMRELGIQGAVRGKRIITTIPGGQVERAPDLVDRDFVALAPNRCWVADFTHVKTWSAVVFVAFVVDTFSRRIVGWSAATVKETVFVLDALEMALWQRDRDQQPVTAGELVHHSDAGSQYTSFRLAEHLEAAGIAASIGSVGDAYDNALMESTIGLFKTELIKPQRPWKTLAQVELATAEWVDWYNHRRLHGEIGHVPPVEYETNYYTELTKPQVTTTICDLYRTRGGSEDCLDEAGDACGAAAELPQEAPILQGGHGLLAQRSDPCVSSVDGLLSCGQTVPPAAEGHSDGSAGALVALVGPAGHARVVERVDQAVCAGRLDVVDGAWQGGRGPQQTPVRIGDHLHVHPVLLVFAGVCAVRRLLFE